MSKEELKRLFGNEAFLARLRKVDSVESLQKFLTEHDMHMSLDEITKVGKNDEELSEKELECIGGGNAFSWVNFAWKCFLQGVE